MTAAVLIVIALVAALAVAARSLITREDYERLQRELRSAE